MRIRRAKISDESTLKAFYMLLLMETKPFGMDVVPSEENVDIYWENTFLPCIKNGTGAILIAESDEPVGAIFWPVMNAGVALNEQYATGLGVYVIKQFRGLGVASALRNKAKEVLSSLGVPSVLGFYHATNEAGIASAQKDGGTVLGSVITFKTNG
jgi:GNAT superfamily N-acetyltransferase